MLDNFDFDFFIYKILNNTNDEAKSIFLNSKKNIALIALKQISGRGRIKKKWISSFGDLTCTFLINKKIPVEKLGQLNIWITFKIFSVLKKTFPNINFKIKWPNDIYLDNKKLGGILIETNIVDNELSFFLIGIGINLTNNPINLEYPTIALNKYVSNPDPLNLFFKISENLTYSILDLKKKNFLNIDENLLMNFKDYKEKVMIKFKKKTIEGTFVSICEKGDLLLVTDNNKIINVNHGDILL